MVTNNKVLTVSYGTFSCTLEGFEESFDTMKAIAEYFRDLAADDRYFGAEPPTPDAEMLARIAEREIERRVQARVDHGAIVLSASDAPQDSQPQALSELRREQPPHEEENAADVAAKAADEGQPDLTEQDVVEDADLVLPESETAPDLADPSPEDTAEAEAEAADQAQGFDAEETRDASAVVDAPHSMETAQSSDAAVPAEAEPAEAVDAAIAAPDDTPEHMPEDMADDMAEVPVSEDITTETAPEAAPDVASEEETAEQTLIDPVVLPDVESDSAAPIDAGPIAAEPVATEETPPIIADAEEQIEDQAVDQAEDSAFSDWDEDDDLDPEFDENSIAAKLERIRAVVSRVDAEPEVGFSEDEHADDVQQDENILADAVEDIEAALQEDAEPVSDAIAPATQPLRARVVRMKKADFDAAVAQGLLEAEPVDEALDDVDAEVVADAPIAEDAIFSDSRLTPEDEAELLAELAEVEAELNRSDTLPADIAQESFDAQQPVAVQDSQVAESDTSEQDTTEPDTPDQEDRAQTDDAAFLLTDVISPPSEAIDEEPQDQKTVQTAELGDGDEDLSRLMAKADTEMEEPEGSRRRRAIAHLRAAVKATKAEQAAGSVSERSDDTEAYRDDLASVVRAVPGEDKDPESARRGPRPATAAPLKLVAAQRIAPEQTDAPQQAEDVAAHAGETEAPETTSRGPVRPRRVSADRLDREEIARSAAPVGAASAVQSDFRDYAESIGATDLPDSLEAAAAYLTFVEGRDRFSRPMLMRMARDANEAGFSRELGLRSFGQLLREKKIEKIAGGRFTANATIRFKPNDRAVG